MRTASASSARAVSASISAASPCRCTATIARVRGVSLRATAAGSRLYVLGSTSAKTGRPPWWSTACAVAMNDSAGMITSSPRPTPAAASAMCRAAVPLLVARQKRLPTKRANSASSAAISGAPAPESTPRSSTRPTAARSASVRIGHRRGRGRSMPSAPRGPGLHPVLVHVVEQRLELVGERVLGDTHGTLEEARQVRHRPRLAAPVRELREADEVEHEGRGQDRVASLPDELRAHLGTQEAPEVDVVPRRLPVAEGGHVLDGDLGVRGVAQRGGQHARLAQELRLLVPRIAQHLAVTP